MREFITRWHDAFPAILLALFIVAAVIFFLFRRKPEDPDAIERERRLRINKIGRIVDGTILEILETPRPPRIERRGWFRPRNPDPAPNSNGVKKLLYYSYSISGVTYETAQDISGFEERICLDRVMSGQAASVKYDPSNPSNSILIADDWSGLH
ncbi:MAG: DUF3592 domain-containing protein [Candidatus Acidiferrales bacterium]